MAILIFIIVHWYASLFFQTFFLHRYAAHSMFTMSKTWEKLFYVGTFIAQGSSYLSPYAYGVMHRLHHAHTDKEEDPHSPTYDPNVFAMMWRSAKVFQNIFDLKDEVEPQYTEGVPNWRSFDKFASHWLTRVFWIAAYTTFYYFFATEWWMFIFLPFHFISGPIHGAIINWFAHKYGYTNFKVDNTSKNLLPFDFLMMGEGYHNNHHKNATNANFGTRWFELDPAYPFILLFNKLHIIKLKV